MNETIRYQFMVKKDRANVFAAIVEAAKQGGKVKEQNEPGGSITFAAKMSATSFNSTFNVNIVGQEDGSTFVSVFTKGDGGLFASNHADKAWEKFLTPFLTVLGEPVTELSSGKPYILRASYVGGNTTQVTNGISQGASIGRAVVGGALFGEAGAIVGGLSGNRRSKSASQEVFSDYGLFNVEFSNGRIREMKVKKKSKEYNEIMVKLV